MKYQLILMFIAAFIVSQAALGAGGQEQHSYRDASPILAPRDADCIYTMPEGINLDDCEVSVASKGSPLTAYFCEALDVEGGILVICDREADDGEADD